MRTKGGRKVEERWKRIEPYKIKTAIPGMEQRLY